jgi:hypothetical protein
MVWPLSRSALVAGPASERTIATMSRVSVRSLFPAVVAFAATTLSFAAPAGAHEGAIGEGGPFRVEITSELPGGLDGRFGNGELEIHVVAGIEVVALGISNEPMVKLDAEGNMFGNENSPTWMMVKDGMNVSPHMGSMNGDAAGEPDWVWVQSGGALQYHEHRIHFMASGVDPSIADGGVVASFSLPMLVDGDAVAITGDLVFDPSLDPAAAADLVAAGAASTSTPAGDEAAGEPEMSTTGGESEPEMSAPGATVADANDAADATGGGAGMMIGVLAVGIAIIVAVAGMFLSRRRN